MRSLKIAPDVKFGCDPELFISRGGRIIGSERVIRPRELHGIALDGVQIELHPRPSVSVQVVGQEISHALRRLRRHLRRKRVMLVFDTLVEVEARELIALSPAAQMLGCLPSRNFYNRAPCHVDGRKYRKRTAAGHIHLGLQPGVLYQERTRLVPLLDLLVGNTCVLIDRDAGAAERRKNYGRAGEYRLPAHGIEYRTPSNFWLRGFPVMELVMGLSKLAVDVLYSTLHPSPLWPNPERDFLSCVDSGEVEKAINTNNLSLARRNFAAIAPILEQLQHPGVINAELIKPFRVIIQRPLQEWLSCQPLRAWSEIEDHYAEGWESLLEDTWKRSS